MSEPGGLIGLEACPPAGGEGSAAAARLHAHPAGRGHREPHRRTASLRVGGLPGVEEKRDAPQDAAGVMWACSVPLLMLQSPQSLCLEG